MGGAMSLRFRLIWLMCTALMLLACNLISSNSAVNPTPTPDNGLNLTPAQVTPTALPSDQNQPPATATPSGGAGQALPTSAVVPISAALPQGFYSALADLNRRLSMDVRLICTNTNDLNTCILSQPILWNWTQSTFSNTALDCPALSGESRSVAGYRFTFSYQGQLYDYRGEENGATFFCQITPA